MTLILVYADYVVVVIGNSILWVEEAFQRLNGEAQNGTPPNEGKAKIYDFWGIKGRFLF